MSTAKAFQYAGKYLNLLGDILKRTKGLTASFLYQFTVEELELYLDRLESIG